MPIRHAEAFWEGTLRRGSGSFKTESGGCENQYSFSRFEERSEANPEELIGAALSACFSMAFSEQLEKAGYVLEKVHTQAAVHLEREGETFRISRIDLSVTARVPGIDDALLWEQAMAAKENCPVSRALIGVEKTLALRHLHQFETERV